MLLVAVFTSFTLLYNVVDLLRFLEREKTGLRYWVLGFRRPPFAEASPDKSARQAGVELQVSPHHAGFHFLIKYIKVFNRHQVKQPL